MLKYEAYHFGENNLFSHYHPHNLNYPRHLHRSFELIFVSHGTIDVSIDSRIFTAEKNNCILILPYEVHSITTKKYSDLNICVFSPEYVKTFHNMIDGKTLEDPVFNLSVNTKSLVIEKIFKDNLNILQMKAYLYLLSSEIMDNTKLLNSERPTYELLHKILNYIQENFTETISLRNVATEFGYSYTYLSKYINNILGISFVDFINENRINYALYLLKNTQAPITEIAYSCGYSSIRSFNRNFLKITKITPKLYKNS